VTEIEVPENLRYTVEHEWIEQTTPELVNSDPYGAGWLVEIAVPEGTDLGVLLEDMLDADAYRAVIEG